MNAIFTPIKNFIKKLDQPLFSTAVDSQDSNKDSEKKRHGYLEDDRSKSDRNLLVSDRDFYICKIGSILMILQTLMTVEAISNLA